MTDVFDPARLDAIRNQQATKPEAIEAAKRIVKIFEDAHPSRAPRGLSLDDVIAVSRALLASEPTQKDRDAAGLILLRAFREPGALAVSMFQLSDMIAAALASARTADRARVRELEAALRKYTHDETGYEHVYCENCKR